ncbi:MAG: FixH family protein, partial [Planctomycetota bacterium]
VGGFVPENEPFEATVTVRTPAGDPVTGARVAMDCRMPDHGHGMLRVPRSEEREGGEYVVRGLLLHMGGFWTVTITVVGDGGVAATADDEVTL